MPAILPGLRSMLNYHPLFVHFPIALWIAALIFEALAVIRSSDALHRAATWALYLGTLFAIPAVASGLFAADSVPEKGPAHEVVETHENLMLLSSSVALGLSILAFFKRNSFTAGLRKFFLLALIVLAGLLTIGSDRGAQLVYQYGTAVNWPAAQRQK